jgi:flagellin-like hook-associated protein FlgL
MASNITLSAGIRQNLLSLQATADLISTTQNRLATGKKVNSALDNPINFFTSQSLSDRASDLNALLDSIGNAQQTLKAADNGISSLTKLVQSAKSLANQALQATKGTVNYSNITGSVALAADTTRVAPSGNLTTAGTVSVQSSSTIVAGGLAELENDDTITFTINGNAQVFTKKAASDAANSEFADAAGLILAINHANGFGGAGAGIALAATDGAGGVTVTSYDLQNDFTHSTNDADFTAGNFTDTAHSLGDALTISDGTNTVSFYRVASATMATAANNTYAAAATLDTAIAGSSLNALIASDATGILTRADGGDIQISGATGVAAYGSAASGTTYAGNYNAALAALTGTLTVQVGSNTVHTITFGSGSGKVDTRSELNTALAAFTDITGSVNSSGYVNLAPTSTDDVAIGGTAANLVALGLNSGTTTPTATVVTPNTTRENLQTQYNDLLTQIDQLAKDASYNGVNLLYGDNLKVTFNENGSSSMSISGVKYDSAGLGMSAISGTGFQDNKIINDTISTIDTSLSTLRTQSSKFGSNLTTVQTRQEFTKAIVNTLQTGADNLVLADSNEEAANVLALQTRQQLSTTALSLANQAAQGVLRLF